MGGSKRNIISSNETTDLFAKRRNLQIKRRVVLSPGEDDPAEYLEMQNDDEHKEKLKRLFLQSYLSSS